jgi:hypothetical protein
MATRVSMGIERKLEAWRHSAGFSPTYEMHRSMRCWSPAFFPPCLTFIARAELRSEEAVRGSRLRHSNSSHVTPRSSIPNSEARQRRSKTLFSSTESC